MGAVDRRVAYWKAETASGLPIGSTKEQAEAFFAARGAKLTCCVTEPGVAKYYLVSERKVGYALWTEYDVVVLVELSPTGDVTSVSVQRWGVGL
jgi:hypothetical protein